MYTHPYGYCGMPCALCSRHHTDGTSRCAGCSHGGYYADVCKAHHCCVEKGAGHCGNCAEYPCVKLGKMGDFRDLDTHNAKRRTCDEIREAGLDAWLALYAERADMLAKALQRYNNGRMKRYLCELFIQRDIDFLRNVLQKAEAIEGDAKERGKAFRELVEAE